LTVLAARLSLDAGTDMPLIENDATTANVVPPSENGALEALPRERDEGRGTWIGALEVGAEVWPSATAFR